MRFPAFEIFEANDLSIPHPPDMRRAQKRPAILRERTILNKSPPELEETSPPAAHVYNSSRTKFLGGSHVARHPRQIQRSFSEARFRQSRHAHARRSPASHSRLVR